MALMMRGRLFQRDVERFADFIGMRVSPDRRVVTLGIPTERMRSPEWLAEAREHIERIAQHLDAIEAAMSQSSQGNANG